MTLTLGPTSPGAPASPGTPCGKGTNGLEVSPGGFGGILIPPGGDRGVSPDLRVCRSHQGDLVALAAPGRGQETHENSDSETPTPNPNPKPQIPVLTWKPEGPGAPCSPLSPAGPCGTDTAQAPQKPLGFQTSPTPRFGDPTSPNTTRAGDLWVWGSPSRSNFGVFIPSPKLPCCTHGRSRGAGGSGLSILARKSLWRRGTPLSPKSHKSYSPPSRASVSPLRGF